MRNAFAQAATELAARHPELVLLAGDIGNRLFNDFKARHPRRFYNCGVAEASMTGIAAGLAAAGMRPITYTIASFNTARCFEQIRLDICYPDLPVIVVGTGAGLAYANLGATHHSLEDIALLRTLPNMHVVCPADPLEVRLALADALRLARPTYIRLGKKGEPAVHPREPAFAIGRGLTVREGREVALLGVGTVLPLALDCARLLAARQVSARVVSLHTVKPLDQPLLRQLFAEYRVVALLEEHGLAGGAGSAVLEWGHGAGVDLRKLVRAGGPDRFLSACGGQQQARASLGLDAETVARQVLDALEAPCS